MSLCQAHIGCFGCCGHHWGDRDAVLSDIERQTRRYLRIPPEALECYARREAVRTLTANGVCKNLVRINGSFGCAMHPARHGRELRDELCQKEYTCRTLRRFREMDAQQQRRFLAFLADKTDDPLEYSKGMDSGRWLREFERATCSSPCLRA